MFAFLTVDAVALPLPWDSVPAQVIAMTQEPLRSEGVVVACEAGLPCGQYLDFDGDGLFDVIVPVAEEATGTSGLAIVQADGRISLVGAGRGTPVVGRDDLDGMGAPRPVTSEDAPRGAVGDVFSLEYGSVVVYFDGDFVRIQGR